MKLIKLMKLIKFMKLINEQTNERMNEWDFRARFVHIQARLWDRCTLNTWRNMGFVTCI